MLEEEARNEVPLQAVNASGPARLNGWSQLGIEQGHWKGFPKTLYIPLHGVQCRVLL